MAVALSVVVPALNEEKNIRACLKSLSCQTVERERYELVVSDSFSSDNTVEIAKELADKVVEHPAKGAGAARNFGVKHSTAEKIAFIDADSVAKKTFVEGALELLDQYIAGTGPIESLEKDSWLVNAFYTWWSFQDWATTKLGFPIFPGFNIAVQKKYFWRSGGFGKRDYTCEDIDLGLKLRRLGRVGYNHKMVVLTSSRRVREGAYIPYILNAWNFVLFHKSRKWAEHRKPEEMLHKKMEK
jgi:glycosyltransferase involved in cell wall biosynthesis